MESVLKNPDDKVVIIGAGPVGLAAAAHLVQRGMPFMIIERSDRVGGHMEEWEHVKLFSPWQYNLDQTAVALLQASGWQAPEESEHPTAAEFYHDYLEPLAQLPAIAPYIHYEESAVAISRQTFDKVKALDREQAPFLIKTTTAAGGCKEYLAAAVIDATGTWGQPNPIGANGLPADGEDDAAAYISYGMPNIAHESLWLKRRVAVVGSGHSAAHNLISLANAARSRKELELFWILRGNDTRRVFGGGINDELPERARLGKQLQHLVDSGRLKVLTDFKIYAVSEAINGVYLAATNAAGEFTEISMDHVIVATGQRPDLTMNRELRIDLDPGLECVRSLAHMIDPNFHHCGNIAPHGAKELKQPEAGFFIVGNKSYGRAPGFLMVIGYEQVRSVVAYLDGDFDAAFDVKLSLPATGICSSEDNPNCCQTAELENNSCC